MPLWINDTPIGDLGLGLSRLQGWRDGTAPVLEVTPLVGLLGGVLAPRGQPSPRVITCTFRVGAESLDERGARMAALADAIAGRVPLRFIDCPDRFVRAVAGPITTVGELDEGPLWYPPLLVSVPFTVTDGVAYDVEPWGPLVGAANERVPLVVGDAASPLEVEILGSMSGSRTLTYRAANGSVRWTFVVSGTLTSDEVLRVRFSDARIVRQSGTTITNAYSWKSSASKWRLCTVDPADADRPADRWPTIEVSAGSMRVLTRRTWRF